MSASDVAMFQALTGGSVSEEDAALWVQMGGSVGVAGATFFTHPDALAEWKAKQASKATDWTDFFRSGFWGMPPAEDRVAMAAAQQQAREDPPSLKGA